MQQGEVMKKLIAICTIFILVLTSNMSFADTIKVYTQTLQDYSINSNCIKFKILKDCTLPKGEILQSGAYLVGKVLDIQDAKRGKQNGYAMVQILEYITPTGNILKVKNPNAIAKVQQYEKYKITEDEVVSKGATVAGLFVKNISYPINFAYGIIRPDEGENRIVSGVQNVYEKSFLSYIGEGKDIEFKANTTFVMVFRTTRTNNE